MTTEDHTAAANSELLRSTFDLLNRGDLEACAARLAPDFVINLAGVPQLHGREVWRQGVEHMLRSFPDLRTSVEDIFGSGDRVAVRLTLRGTHRGDFQGFAATGREVAYASNEIYRVTDGVIAEEWICSDMAGLIAQLS